MKVWLAALAALALVQLTLAGRVDPVIPEPNLVLAAVAAWTWLQGARAGMLAALAGGFLLDLGGSGPLGVHALAMLAAAYAVGSLGAALASSGPRLAAVAGMVAAAVYSAVVLGTADGLGLTAVGVREAVGLIGGEMLVAALLTPLAVILLRRLAPSPAVEW